MRIALVDDSSSALMALQTYLRPLGDVHIHAYHSGREILAHAEEHAFDVVICDYLMPGMDGVEVIRHLRGMPAYKAVPLVMVTSSSQMSVRQSAIEAGATDFLQKPIEPMELVARVRNLLALRVAHLELLERNRMLDGAMNLAMVALGQREEEIIWRLARAIEARDGDTGGHVSRMATICMLIAHELAWSRNAAGRSISPHRCTTSARSAFPTPFSPSPAAFRPRNFR